MKKTKKLIEKADSVINFLEWEIQYISGFNNAAVEFEYKELKEKYNKTRDKLLKESKMKYTDAQRKELMKKHYTSKVKRVYIPLYKYEYRSITGDIIIRENYIDSYSLASELGKEEVELYKIHYPTAKDIYLGIQKLIADHNVKIEDVNWTLNDEAGYVDEWDSEGAQLSEVQFWIEVKNTNVDIDEELFKKEEQRKKWEQITAARDKKKELKERKLFDSLKAKYE